jgi:hypothetical protein
VNPSGSWSKGSLSKLTIASAASCTGRPWSSSPSSGTGSSGHARVAAT